MAPPTPSAVVQRQLDAYNAREVDALVAVYAEDARQFDLTSGQLLAAGRDQLRARFAVRLAEPNLHAELLHRSVVGPVVVDHERITRTFPDGPGTLEMIAVYEVRGEHIACAWFQAGPPQLAVARG